MLAERLGAAFDEVRERDRRGVGRDCRVRSAVRLDPGVERLLEVKPLDDRLDDPVALGQPGQIVVDIAGLDQPGRAAPHEWSRIGLEHFLDRTARDRAAIGRVPHDIKQQHRHPGIGHLRGDPGPHRAGPDHRDLADRGWAARARRAHAADSSTVAMPCPPPMHWVASA